MNTTRAVVAVSVAAALLVACGRDAKPSVKLDGSPRVPNVEGVVEKVTREVVVLDGDRTYELDPSLQSFSTYNLASASVFDRLGQYVHLGVDGDRAYWMAGIGTVTAGESASVYYVGVFEKEVDGRAVFEDGTTLKLSKGADMPKAGTRVRVLVSVSQRSIVSIEPA